MRLKKQTNKQKFSLLWRQLEMLPHSLHLGLSGSFFWSLSCPPKALWLAWGGALGTGHSLLTLVLQECSTTLKRRGSCSRGTFTIFPGNKVRKKELAVALVERHVYLLLGWQRENVAFLSDWGKKSAGHHKGQIDQANILIPRSILMP